MQKEYYELQIIPDTHIDIFTDFVFDCSIEAVELKDNTIIVRSEDDLSELRWGVEELAKKLSKTLNDKIHIKTELIKNSNEDWIQKYKNSIKPVKVGKFYIHPTWESDKKGYINILIDPALSFGTGHHESTSSCLELLGETIAKDKTLLDVGCGSGILSIAAYKLGAKVDLSDSDEMSIESAKNNFKLNGAHYNEIWVGSANKAKTSYDVVVANIVADVLIMISKDLKNTLKRDGVLILSGILDKYLDNVLSKFDEFKTIKIIKKKEWRTLLLSKG